VRQFITVQSFPPDAVAAARIEAIAAGYNETEPLFEHVLLEILAGGMNITHGLGGVNSEDYTRNNATVIGLDLACCAWPTSPQRYFPTQPIVVPTRANHRFRQHQQLLLLTWYRVLLIKSRLATVRRAMISLFPR
jgi:hypothetical protein